jgi:ribosome-binding protein aMBF1 (putative translation factor)
MGESKRKALESAGFQVGTAADFLGLSEAEQQLVHLRLRLSQAIRRRREKSQLTQQQVARRIQSSQSRVAKIESAATDVSLDLLFRCLFSLGGTLNDLEPMETSAS